MLTKTDPFSFPFQGFTLASDMKPAHHTLFRDQVSTLVEWFANWNECEQTIALYTLLKRISTIQARFLSLILEHTFRDDSFEVQVMQRRANDKGKFTVLGQARAYGLVLFTTVGIFQRAWDNLPNDENSGTGAKKITLCN